jgi:hypothetical protein
MATARRSTLSVGAAMMVAIMTLTACGSSKPAYCSKRSTLEQSVKGLGDVDVKSGGLDALKSQLKKVESDATALVNSAKSDFPSETSAIDSSVNKLAATIQNTPSSPTATQVTTLVGDATNVATATKDFTDASNSKCS